jgi:hypothetical protein
MICNWVINVYLIDRCNDWIFGTSFICWEETDYVCKDFTHDLIFDVYIQIPVYSGIILTGFILFTFNIPNLNCVIYPLLVFA